MKIYISATLRNFFGRNARIEIPASTVRKALAILLDMYPDAKNVLYDDGGKLRNFIQIYVNGKNLTVETLWETPLPEETEIDDEIENALRQIIPGFDDLDEDTKNGLRRDIAGSL